MHVHQRSRTSLVTDIYYTELHAGKVRQDKDRTRTGQGQDKDRTRTGQGQDKDRTRTGQGQDKDRTRTGQGQDKDRTRPWSSEHNNVRTNSSIY
jgi:hypothetical protein